MPKSSPKTSLDPARDVPVFRAGTPVRSAQSLVPLTPADGKRPRGVRRGVIMREAARLFCERGFHATGMDEIGRAANVTGPAVYRHFKNKEDLLLALLEDVVERVAADIAAVREQGGSPSEMLERLTVSQIRLAVENAPLTALAMTEIRSVPKEHRHRILRRDKLNREEWVHLLGEERGDRSEPEVRTMVAGISGLISAMSLADTGLPDEQLEELMTTMVLAAIRAS